MAGETLSRCPDTEVFATGDYPQGRYGLADACEMVRNLRKVGKNGLKLYSATVGAIPPTELGIGHEADDAATKAYLARTDRPALGALDPATAKVVPYRLDGKWHGTVVADIEDVTADVAAAIRDKRYRRVSVEIYDDFRDDFGNDHGKVIKRVCLLGLEPSGVKRTADLPMPVRQFGERLRLTKRIPSGPGRFLCFAEYRPMSVDVAKIMAAVKKVVPDLDEAKLAGLTDLLAAMSGDAAPPADAPMEEPAAFADGERDALIAELAAMGQDPAALAAMSDADLKSLKESAMKPADAAMGEQAKKMFAEMKTLRADAQAARDATVKLFAEAAGKKREADVQALVATLTRTGKVLPAEADGVKARLLRADGVKVFSEGGKNTTEYDSQVAELNRRPVLVKFGERLPGSGAAATADHEVAKVRDWAERNADALKRSGKSVEGYVKAFSEIQKVKPDVTAEKFGVPATA